MSASKRTPGEWLADLDAGWIYTRSNPLTRLVIAATESGSADEQRANAHLIAAAPDMLEALKQQLAYEAAPSGPGRLNWMELVKLRNTAISKAEGR